MNAILNAEEHPRAGHNWIDWHAAQTTYGSRFCLLRQSEQYKNSGICVSTP